MTKITTPELLDFPKDSTSSANTEGTVIPTGTTLTRPTNPSTGEFRYNTTDKLVEFFDGSVWKQIGDEPV